jgi:hypothetical protein
MPRGQERCHYLGRGVTTLLALWRMTSMSANAADWSTRDAWRPRVLVGG